MGIGLYRKSAASGARRVDLRWLELIEPRTMGGRLIFVALLRSYRSLAVVVWYPCRAPAR